jgi:CRP/FNR family transcriptional regulator, anaerobic regulatory protein
MSHTTTSTVLATTAHVATRIDIHQLKAACTNCSLRELCLPAGLTLIEIEQLSEVVDARRRVKRGEAIIRAGQHFSALYAVRTGFFKTCVLIADGREQVTGFSMTGELLGMDGIGDDVYQSDAIAIEDSEVCIIPFDNLDALAQEMPSLQRHFHKVMSREIVRESSVMMMLGVMHAEERLAVFLLNLSQRLNARGFAPLEFRLRMTRAEIGSYLGLKLETVSRTFSKFQADGILEVSQKMIRILDIVRLRKIYAHHT